MISSGEVRPKITINTQPNRALIEYSNDRTPVEIITPPPRTEFMQGFEPLKKD